jgi:hypothetical protein
MAAEHAPKPEYRVRPARVSAAGPVDCGRKSAPVDVSIGILVRTLQSMVRRGLAAPRVVSADQRYGKDGGFAAEHPPRRTRPTAKYEKLGSVTFLHPQKGN